MANKKISELQSRTPALSDLMLVGDPSSGYSYKCTVTALATIIETDIADGYVTIGTTQTISGAKTFSNNLTLTSVVNTPTDPDKFLTLNASNVVTYRTGSQVLSDIGAADDTLVVHLAGTETITGYKTFSSFAGFDSAISIKQNSTIVSQTGYGSIAASSTGFFLTRATGIHAFFNLNSLTTGRNFTFPDVTGTIALTSDITDALAGYVPTSRTLTINGVTQSLAANRTFNVGTVETVNFATGTTGTDVNVSGSPITTTGTITLNIPTASATNRGALSSTDWTTFNNKQNALTLTTTGTSGAATLVGSTLNIPQYQAALTNPVTGTGTTNYIPKFTSSSAIGDSPLYDASGSIGLNSTTPALNGFNRELTVNAGTSGTARAAINIQGSRTSASTFGVLGFFHQTTYVAGIESSRGGDATSGILQFFTSNTTGATERMRLDASGRLLVGTTTSSGAKLDVVSGAGLNTYFNSTGTGIYLQIANNGNNLGYIGDGSILISGGSSTDFVLRSQAALAFSTNGNTERMRLDASGNLGLGRTPAFRLDVQTSAVSGGVDYVRFQNGATNAAGNAIAILLGDASDNKAEIRATTVDANNGYLGFYTQGSGNRTEKMRLDASGNLGLGTSSPAAKLHVAAAPVSGTIDRAVIIANSSAIGSGSGSEIYLGWNSPSVYAGAGVTIGASYAGGGTNMLFSTPSSISSAPNVKMTLDGDGNLGLGVSPAAWSGGQALQILKGSLYGSGNLIGYAANSYLANNAANDRYIVTGAAIKYLGNINGDHRWYVAPSGTAGDVISFTQAMTLDASGRLGIGATSPGYRLEVNGDIGFSGGASLKWGGNTYIYGSNNVQLEARVNGNLGWYINSSGQVGIGTTSPASLLHIFSTSPTARLQGNTTTNLATISTLSFSNTNDITGGYQVASISAIRKDYDNGADLLFSTALAASTPTERMRITSGGNVGIGTTSPGSILELYQATPILTFNGTTPSSAFGLEFKSGGLDAFIKATPANGLFNIASGRSAGWGGFITFTTDASERMRITSGGNVLVGGTSDNGSRLQVTGAATFSSSVTAGSSILISNTINAYAYQNFGANSGYGWQIGKADNSTGLAPSNGFYFYDLTNSATRMVISQSGNVGIGTTSPAYKLDVLGNIQASDNILIGNGSNAAYGLEVGYGRTTTGSSYVDLIGGDITYQDYGSRFTRESGGANANTGIYHRGTGLLKLSAQDAGDITFETTSIERMRITSGGELLINTTSDAGDYKLQVNGNGLFTNSATSLLEVRATNTGGTAQILLNPANNNSYTIQTNGSTDNLTFIRNSTTLATISNIGNAEFGGSIKTAAPSGGTAKPIKFGEIVTLGGSNTQGVRVEIDGTVYYLVTGYLP